MKLLVTGASGFLGRHVVSAALSRGHEVRAAVRTSRDTQQLYWASDSRVELARIDLRSRRGLVEALAGIDAVIHTAAAKSGDLFAQLAGTVLATENLIAAMNEAGVNRIVGVSSFSVYDYTRLWAHSKLDESAKVICENAFTRDDYAQTKLLQEQLILEQQEKSGWRVTIVRPGVIYGRDNVWTARLGACGAGQTWIRIGMWAQLPLVYVENCAEALVLAAESKDAIGQIFNCVDDNPPRQHQYAKAIRKRLTAKPSRVIFIPWRAVWLLGWCAMFINSTIFKGRAKLPSVLVPDRLEARFKPLKFDNHKIKTTIGWSSRYSLGEALDRIFAGVPPLPMEEMQRNAPESDTTRVPVTVAQP